MWLISTWTGWTCFWLLLKLSLIGNVSSLSCYNCGTELDCAEDQKPFNSVQCTDPDAACTIVLQKYPRSPGVDDKVVFRGCAHPEWITQLLGAVDYCKKIKKEDGSNLFDSANNWVKAHPDKDVGGIQNFYPDSQAPHVICTCTDADNCNEKVGEVGKHYPVPADTSNNNGCNCPDKKDKCEKKKSK